MELPTAHRPSDWYVLIVIAAKVIVLITLSHILFASSRGRSSEVVRVPIVSSMMRAVVSLWQKAAKEQPHFIPRIETDLVPAAAHEWLRSEAA